MTHVRRELIPKWWRQARPELLLLWPFLFLPGCVVQDIHDDLAATRASVERIAELAPALRQTNASLETSNIQLERLYGELASTHKSLELVLARLDTTNVHLQESAQQLRHLDPMMASLKNLDESLAALRRVVQNIDKAVPLLSLGKGTPPVDGVLKPQGGEATEQRPLPASQAP